MEGLSIEEKAKRYDKTIEQLRTMMPNWESLSYNGKTFLQDLVHIIPELKESEGERIRKELIAMVKLSCTNGDDADKKIAWLEKQGEQKLVKCNMEWYDFVRCFVKERTNNYTLIPSDADIHTWGGIILKHAKKELEKQGEQKPNPCDGCINRKGCINCENGELRETEQRSVWGEEDETGLTNTIIMLKEGASLHFNKKDITKAVDWLKSLKERVQPKQKWSEEDERNLQGVIDEIQANKNNAPYYDLETYDRFLNWLKSLKPHSTWKPSDKQMDVLLSEVSAWTKGCHKQIILESIYNDLKKLKE